MIRLFFCTDLHGSEICFRKFLSAGRVYDASVVIMGGDCTGKMIVPFVGENGGPYQVTWAGRTSTLTPGEQLDTIEGEVRNGGMYPIKVSAVEMAALEADPSRRGRLFSTVMLDTLRRWLQLAEERLRESGLHVIVTPGNDDEWSVDGVLAASSFIDAAEGKIVTLGSDGDTYEMLSLGWSNPTPWDTPRECAEYELADKIGVLARQIQDMDRAIFNIHVPPYGTGLDSAPELEDGTKMKRGGTISKAVGSTAVKEAILEYQPLLSLHGHIHESRGIQKLGRTTCINPGSTYQDWELQGVLVDLDRGSVKRYVPTTG
jgi:Icc-related predicted phosphoesterase